MCTLFFKNAFPITTSYFCLSLIAWNSPLPWYVFGHIHDMRHMTLPFEVKLVLWFKLVLWLCTCVLHACIFVYLFLHKCMFNTWLWGQIQLYIPVDMDHYNHVQNLNLGACFCRLNISYTDLERLGYCLAHTGLDWWKSVHCNNSRIYSTCI